MHTHSSFQIGVRMVGWAAFLITLVSTAVVMANVGG